MLKIYGTPEWDKLLERLKGNDPTFTQLNLYGNQIGDSGATALSLALKENHTLTTLYLDSNQIRDSGATALSLALKENHTLTTLYLNSNQIGASGVTALSLALKENHTLTTLYLCVNQIGDSGTTALSLALKENHTLTTLNLGANQIGDSGATALSLALKENHTLTTLHLYGNQIGDSGATALSLALQENHTLITLDLDSNQIEDSEAEKQIVEILTHNKKRVVQRRDQFIQAMVILARDSADPLSQSLWKQLPKDLVGYILRFIAFRSDESIGKSADQTYDCAVFIFKNISTLNESLRQGQGLTIIETVVNNKPHFRFFQPKPQALSPASLLTAEETIQANNKMQKTVS